MRNKFQDWLCPECCLKLDTTEDRKLRNNVQQECYNCNHVYVLNGLNVERTLTLKIDMSDYYNKKGNKHSL